MAQKRHEGILNQLGLLRKQGMAGSGNHDEFELLGKPIAQSEPDTLPTELTRIRRPLRKAPRPDSAVKHSLLIGLNTVAANKSFPF